MKVFTDYIVVLLKARKAGWHRELPARRYILTWVWRI